MEPYLTETWDIVKPIVQVFAAIVGPVLATWIAAQIIGILGIKSDADKAAAEKQIKDALHEAALNGLKKVIADRGLTGIVNIDDILNAPSDGTPSILHEVVSYVQDKNPDGVAKFKLTPKAIADIALSKVQDVLPVPPAAIVAPVVVEKTK